MSSNSIFDISNSSSVTTTDTSTKRVFIPSETYLPEYARDEEFFRNICILIDYLEDALQDFSNPKYAGVAQAYKDIGFKYRDIMQVSEDALKKMLSEHGFGAILDLFDLPFEKLQMFALYLPLFKALKGTDEGFRLLLELISYDFELTSWLDDPANLEEYTYNITFVTFLNVGFDSEIVQKFIKFSRTYIYPTLKKMIIKAMFRQQAPAVYGVPIVTKEVKLRCFDEPE